MTLVITIALFALGLLPAFFVWLNAKRLYELSKARLRIAKCVTESERLMLQGTPCLGETSHDNFFKFMQKVQFAETYPVPWNLFKAPTEEEKRSRDLLIKELSGKNGGFAVQVGTFTNAYFDSFKYNHPFLYLVYRVYLFLIIILASASVYILRAVAVILKGLVHITDAEKGLKKASSKAKEKIVRARLAIQRATTEVPASFTAKSLASSSVVETACHTY